MADSICQGMYWCAGLDRRWDVVRRPHISIDVREGEAYALSMEEVGGYNPHIAQTVPQRCSAPLPAMACHLCGAP